MHVPMAANNLGRLGRLPWPWRVGLGAPLLLGLLLAFGVAVSWLSGREYTPPDELEAGSASDYPVGLPKLFEEDDIWVVQLAEGEFLALYDRGVEAGCPLEWKRQYAFQGAAGWFVDACTGSVYDLTGRCFSEACLGRALSRFAISSEGGEVVVDLRVIERDPQVDPDAPPVNPQE
jgi:hypothetical protein